MVASTPPIVLNSWKEIASYLGRGVRTVQRYERNSQLPVRRLRGKVHGAVIAFPKDLDMWLRGEALRETGFPTVGNFRGWYALQKHRTAITTLQGNLLTLAKRLEEGQRIRTCQHLFGQDVPDNSYEEKAA